MFNSGYSTGIGSSDRSSSATESSASLLQRWSSHRLPRRVLQCSRCLYGHHSHHSGGLSLSAGVTSRCTADEKCHLWVDLSEIIETKSVLAEQHSGRTDHQSAIERYETNRLSCLLFGVHVHCAHTDRHHGVHSVDISRLCLIRRRCNVAVVDSDSS